MNVRTDEDENELRPRELLIMMFLRCIDANPPSLRIPQTYFKPSLLASGKVRSACGCSLERHYCQWVAPI